MCYYGVIIMLCPSVTALMFLSEWRDEAESRNRSAVQMKAVLMVQQPGGQQGALLLWGAAMDWLPRFSKHKGTRGQRSQNDPAHPVLYVEPGELGTGLIQSGSEPWTGSGASVHFCPQMLCGTSECS